MTSSDSGINSLVDWTSMKTIRYFSMRDGEQKVEDEGIKYKVRSICYYGGSPRGNMYAFVGSNVIKYLFLFSAINRNMLAKPELQDFSTSATITWVNHTKYIYVFQTGILGRAGFMFSSNIYYLGPKSNITFRNKTDQMNFFPEMFLNPTMLAFSTNITSNEVYEEIYDRLDYFYLFITSSGNSISIQIPQFNWDRCSFDSDSQPELRMYYGRYRHCSENHCRLDYRNRQDYDSQKDEIAIQCQKITCEDGQMLHVAPGEFDGFVDKLFPKFDLADNLTHWVIKHGEADSTMFTKVGQRVRMRPKIRTPWWSFGGNSLYCIERYELKESEIEVANDNGCWRGFNLDDNGICRACQYVELPGTGVKFRPSDCLLWLHFDEISKDTLTYSYYHYDKTLLDLELHYKGFEGDELYYRKMFFEKKDIEGNVIEEIHDYIGSSGQYNLRESDSYLMLKQCYSLSYSQAKTPKYELRTLDGYTLTLISNDPTGQAESQINRYGETTPLNTFYWRKTCLQGYYYDFNSISCRRCNYGCDLCQRFDHCDLCQPGFHKVKKPIHSIHQVDEEMIGQCQRGCQSGFYGKAFDGECLECYENCLRCVDSMFVFKEKYDQKRDHPSFCLDCFQEKKEGVSKNFINLNTGVCQPGCDEKISNGSVIKETTSEFCHSCGRGCDDCEIPNTSNCNSCYGGFYFENDTKKCLMLTETRRFRADLLILVGVAFILLFVMVLVCICRKIRIDNRAQEIRERKKRVLSAFKNKKVFFKSISRQKAARIITKAIREYNQKKITGEQVKTPIEQNEDLTCTSSKTATATNSKLQILSFSNYRHSRN